MASQPQPSVANRLDELEKKVDDCSNMQWTGMGHFSEAFNQITSLLNQITSLKHRLDVLEQKLLGEGGQGKAIGGRNTYDVGKDPLNVVPQWAK
jgi:tetrahydromethanopterin S-methyltransferase subunit G